MSYGYLDFRLYCDMIGTRIMFLFFFLTCLLPAKSQVNYELQSEVCLSVTYKDLGFTKSFESPVELQQFLFTHNLLFQDPAVDSVKILKLTDLYEEYFGIHKYCQKLYVLEIKESEFKDLDEGIKQRLAGI